MKHAIIWVPGVFIWIAIGLLLWFAWARINEKKRRRQGLRPIPYHRYLVPRPGGVRFEPQTKASFDRQDDQGYHMEPLGPPPPVYNPDLAPPPGITTPQTVPTVTPPQEPIRQTVDIERGIEPDAGENVSVNGGRLQKFRNNLNPFSK